MLKAIKINQKLWRLSLGVNTLFIVFILLFFPDVDTSEEGILEIMQAFFIAVSMVIYAFCAFFDRAIGTRLTSLTLSLLSLSFLLRELDVGKYDIPSIFILLGSGIGKNVLTGLLWIFLFIVLFKLRKKFWQSNNGFLSSKQGQLLMISALMLLLGALMDKNIFSLETDTTRFYEELLELLGYVYLFTVSIFRLKNLGLIEESST